jgi:hypothetical protein
MARERINTGSVAVRALRPINPKGAGGWRIAEGRVAADSPEAAASFAADLIASLKAHSALEDARPAPDGTVDLGSGVACKGDKGTTYGCLATFHIAGCGYKYGTVGELRKATDVGLADLVDRYRAERGIVDTVAPPAPPAPVAKTRKVASRRTAEPTPIPAPAPTPAPTGMGACDRCGRTDWKTPAGRAWHVDNNPDCAKYRKPGKHAYAA